MNLYIIECATNMHVGSGNASFTVVDNQVERDVITNFPIINSSSLKGSLKNFLSNKEGQEDKNKNVDKDKINLEYTNQIFGDEKNSGKYRIFPGMLLSYPVRSNIRPFFRAICPQIIDDLKNFLDGFKINLSEFNGIDEICKLADKNKNSICIIKELNNDINEVSNIKVEGYNAKVIKADLKDDQIKNMNELFGENLVVMDNETFSEIMDELPVIARNKLDNGESENLWYEEVVPRQTQFYFGAIDSEKDYKDGEKDNCEKLFNKIVFDKFKEYVQIGGNATIGYGYCKITKHDFPGRQDEKHE